MEKPLLNRIFRYQIRRVPKQMIWGTGIFALVFIVAMIGPYIAPYPFDHMNFAKRLSPPRADHWMGTDEYGRDVTSRMLVGGRLSLVMGIGATLLSMLIGVPLGLIAGYFRGNLEEIIMRSVDVFMSIPPILLGLLILAVTPPSLWKTSVAVGIIYVPIMVRLTRSVTLDVSGEEFVQAARARGDRAYYILGLEILPNAWPPIIVEGAMRVTFAIMIGAALSFLGLGVQPPSSDWGLMIAEARPFIHSAPWIGLAPGIALSITIIGINLLGDGLRHMLDPRMKPQRS
ncbi:MAG: ABC transporter permease [Deltaproteobacteria bacterium]|nr:ABC transporter permease [Deltaproteobacteria bacterium]